MKNDIYVCLINDCAETRVPDKADIDTWVESAYLGTQPISVSVKIVDEQESQKLNSLYRHKIKPTNVLSFPMNITDSDGRLLLGDIAICASVLSREASEQDKTLESHWAHMIIHGMLHLQGYDHVESEAAQAMETLEKKILHKLGYADPYV